MAPTSNTLTEAPPYEEKTDSTVVDKEKDVDSPGYRRPSYSSIRRGDFTHRKLKVGAIDVQNAETMADNTHCRLDTSSL